MPKLTYSTGGVDIAARTFWMTKDVVVQQVRGTSKADVMSQAAVTHELELIDSHIFDIKQDKLNKSEAEQVYLSKIMAESLYAPADADYVYKNDLPDLSDYSELLRRNELPSKVSYFENDAEYLTQSYLEGNYYTISEINEKLKDIKPDTENWLYNYYDKEQIDDLLRKAKESDDNLHNIYEQRLSDLEAIDHGIYAEKSELDVFVTNEKFDASISELDEKTYTKEETDAKIAEAISAENLDSYLTKEEASETYQPIGDYLTEHQSLDEYAKTEYVNAEISGKISEAIDSLNIDSYLTKDEAENTYQPIGEYLTEHQSLDHLMSIERAEAEHEEIYKDINELDARMEVVENISGSFEFFKDWKPGYYAEEDTGLEEIIEHDGCYHLIADIQNCKLTDFFAHFPPCTYNYFVYEYNGYPAKNTFVKKTRKEQFDLVWNLDSKTKYVVCYAFTPDIYTQQYYLRGVKITDENKEHVTLREFNQAIADIDSRIENIQQPDVDLSSIEEILKFTGVTEYKEIDTPLSSNYYTLEYGATIKSLSYPDARGLVLNREQFEGYDLIYIQTATPHLYNWGNVLYSLQGPDNQFRNGYNINQSNPNDYYYTEKQPLHGFIKILATTNVISLGGFQKDEAFKAYLLKSDALSASLLSLVETDKMYLSKTIYDDFIKYTYESDRQNPFKSDADAYVGIVNTYINRELMQGKTEITVDSWCNYGYSIDSGGYISPTIYEQFKGMMLDTNGAYKLKFSLSHDNNLIPANYITEFGGFKTNFIKQTNVTNMSELELDPRTKYVYVNTLWGGNGFGDSVTLLFRENEGGNSGSYDDSEIKSEITGIQNQLDGIDRLLSEILGA